MRSILLPILSLVIVPFSGCDEIYEVSPEPALDIPDSGPPLDGGPSSGTPLDGGPSFDIGPDGHPPFDVMPEPLQTVSPEPPQALVDGPSADWSVGRAMVRDGSNLLVADPDHEALFVLSADGSVETEVDLLGGGPERVVALPNGDWWVTLRESGELARIRNNEVTRVPILTEPYAIAAHPTLPLLYVSGLADAKVVAFDTASMAIVDTVSVERPRAVIASDDKLFVASESEGVLGLSLGAAGGFSGGDWTSPYRSRNPWMFHSVERRSVRASQVVFDPRDQSVLAVHALATPGTEMLAFGLIFGEEDGEQSAGYGAGFFPTNDFGVPQRPLEGTVSRIPTVSNHVAANIQDGQAVLPPVAIGLAETDATQDGTVALHLLDQPMDIIHHPTLTVAFIAAQGTDTVVAINTALDDPSASPLAVWEVGQAPKSLALSADATTLYVLEAHDYSVGTIEVGDLGAQGTLARYDVATGSTPYAGNPLSEAMARGRRMFTHSRNDAMSENHLFACASCHFDGREDQVAWAIEGTVRQTPVLAGRLANTAPFNWKGTEDHLEGNMSQTILRLGGTEIPEDQLEDLKAFMLHGLRPIPNPSLGRQQRALNPVEQLGETLFHDTTVGCAGCHAGPETTDGKFYNVGTASSHEKEFQAGEPDLGVFNTPSLRSLHYTAPYLHDGSAPTLRDVLEMTGDTMGHTSQLLDSEKDALIAYLLTL